MNAIESHVLHSLEDTRAQASALANGLRCGDVVALHGDLGVGKTTFVQYVVQALGGAEVTSPTFTLLQTYPVTLNGGSQVTLFHYDLYRINSVEELDELGLREISDGVAIIEWPQRLSDYSIITHFVHLALQADGSRIMKMGKNHETARS